MATDDESKDQRDADQSDETQNDSRDTDDLGEKGREALKREREARKAAEKERTDLAKKIADLEKQQQDRERDEAQKRGEWEKVAKDRETELAKLTASLAERDRNDLKRTIAADEGLPAHWALRLTGGDEEALRADAKAIAKDLKTREPADTDAGDRTKPGQKKPDKKEFASTARWGIR